MPTNEQRRQAAKRRLERQIERRAEKARRRRRLLVIGSVVGVLAVAAVAVGTYLIVNSGSGPDPVAAGSCVYTPDQAASRPVTPPDPDPAREGTVDLALDTSQGPIGLTLDRATAPCAVNAVTSLAEQGYYDDTPCHRLTTGEGLKVLQCGDPTGSGSGGPGFRYAEEPPAGLAPSPLSPQASTYGRGLVAMAKTSEPATTGSQFFLVFGDSALPPEYTVLGRIDPTGLATVDKVAAAGSNNSNGEGDGGPNLPVQIRAATVTS